MGLLTQPRVDTSRTASWAGGRRSSAGRWRQRMRVNADGRGADDADDGQLPHGRRDSAGGKAWAASDRGAAVCDARLSGRTAAPSFLDRSGTGSSDSNAMQDAKAFVAAAPKPKEWKVYDGGHSPTLRQPASTTAAAAGEPLRDRDPVPTAGAGREVVGSNPRAPTSGGRCVTQVVEPGWNAGGGS